MAKETHEETNCLPPIPTHKGQKVDIVKRQTGNEFYYSIIVSLRNMPLYMVRNCINGIKLQTTPNIELIVVDYGSSLENNRNLVGALRGVDCTIYYYKTSDLWSLSICRNIGIRRAKTRKYIATLDADCILSPKTIEFIIGKHEDNPNSIVVLAPMFLPADFNCENLVLPMDYPKINSAKWKYVPPSVGSFVSAPRDWWFKIRGFDERMKGYGVEDTDLWDRAKRDEKIKCIKLRETDTPPETRIFHQYHGARARTNIRINRFIFENDKSIIKNTDAWGILV